MEAQENCCKGGARLDEGEGRGRRRRRSSCNLNFTCMKNAAHLLNARDVPVEQWSSWAAGRQDGDRG